jgi:hypothetical protein
MNVYRDPKMDFTQKRYEFEADNGKQAGTWFLTRASQRLMGSGDCIDHTGTVSL